MIEIAIPGYKTLQLDHLVLDYNGTLACDGEFIPGVKERFGELSRSLSVFVLTSDTFGTARKELEGVNCKVEVLAGENHGRQKQKYVEALGRDSVVAFGNGRNDEEMLKTSRIGAAVIGGEGCAAAALRSADLAVVSITDGLDLLLHPKRLIATLRR